MPLCCLSCINGFRNLREYDWDYSIPTLPCTCQFTSFYYCTCRWLYSHLMHCWNYGEWQWIQSVVSWQLANSRLTVNRLWADCRQTVSQCNGHHLYLHCKIHITHRWHVGCASVTCCLLICCLFLYIEIITVSNITVMSDFKSLCWVDSYFFAIKKS